MSVLAARRFGFVHRRWFALTLTVSFALSFAGLLLACSPGASSSGAANSPARATASAAKAPTPQHDVFMWKTQSSVASAFLLGSIHVANPELYPLDARIERAFEASDHLVLETDPDEEVMAESMLVLVEKALLPRGENAFSGLDPDLAARLRERLLELELDPDQLAGFKPWFIAMTLSSRQLEESGFSGEFGIDMHFRERALGHKPILALERVDEQVELLIQLGEGAQEEDLRMVLEDDGAAFMTGVFSEWVRGETTSLAAEMAEMRRDYPLAYEALFTARNQRMTEKIAELLSRPGTYFIVVGAGHLVGEQSIIDLLERRGFALAQQ